VPRRDLTNAPHTTSYLKKGKQLALLCFLFERGGEKRKRGTRLRDKRKRMNLEHVRGVGIRAGRVIITGSHFRSRKKKRRRESDQFQASGKRKKRGVLRKPEIMSPCFLLGST